MFVYITNLYVFVHVCVQGTFCMKSMKQRRMIQLIQRDHAPSSSSGSAALRSLSEDIV